MEKVVQNREKEQDPTIDVAVARKDYEKPELTVYENLKVVTGTGSF